MKNIHEEAEKTLDALIETSKETDKTMDSLIETLNQLKKKPVTEETEKTDAAVKAMNASIEAITKLTTKNEEDIIKERTANLDNALAESIAEHYAVQCDKFWDMVPQDVRLMMFYSVVKRIHKAELEDQGSYRWALYDVFGFGPEAYSIGMECGYFELHNSIYTHEEIEVLRTVALDIGVKE